LIIPYPSSKCTYTPWKSLVDVSFDFFDPNPKVDYHAIKRLLTQLLQRDAEELHVNELAELILSQPTVGTTIKTDGIESDPFALFTVLNMHLHHVRFHNFDVTQKISTSILQQNPSIKAIANYLLSVTSTRDTAFHETLKALFSQSDAHVGLVLCERLVNMPIQVVPPMYNMLANEMKWAIDDVRWFFSYDSCSATPTFFGDRENHIISRI